MAHSKVPRHHPPSASHPSAPCHGHGAISLQGIQDRRSSLLNPRGEAGLGDFCPLPASAPLLSSSLPPISFPSLSRAHLRFAASWPVCA